MKHFTRILEVENKHLISGGKCFIFFREKRYYVPRRFSFVISDKTNYFSVKETAIKLVEGSYFFVCHYYQKMCSILQTIK